MTTPMHDLFDDLAATVPASVSSAGLAKLAYADGRRRRRARRLRTVSLATFVVLLAILVLPTTVVPEVQALSGGKRPKGVHGYPRRIDHQWLIRNLPGRPGPVAGLLQAVHHHATWDELDGRYAVSASGHRWRIPDGARDADQYPNLSSDGRWLGYMSSKGGPYVVQDLVAGRRIEYPQLGSNTVPGPITPYAGQGQSPGFWSPDGRRLLLIGSAPSGPQGSGLILEPASGALTAIGRVGHAAILAGWSGNDRIVWLEPTSKGLGAAPDRIDQVETDVQGNEIRRVRLRAAEPWRDTLNQWSASVSPSGEQVAISEHDAGSARVRRFSLETGLEVQPVLTSTGIYEPCGLAWAGSAVVVPKHLRGVLLVERLRPKGSATVRVTRSVVSSRVGGQCIVWASDAIGGSARGGWVFGTQTATWTWWWREWLLGAAALIAAPLAWAFWIRRIRRRRRQSFEWTTTPGR